MKIEVKQLHADASLPKPATEGAAGFDLCACIERPLALYPGDCRLIPTGIAIHIQDEGVAAMLLPRSGLGHKRGIVLGNLTGLIDSDYQGEIFISAWNRSEPDTKPYTIHPFQRIAQMIFVPVLHPRLIEVDEFSLMTEREAAGFGSTGT